MLTLLCAVGFQSCKDDNDDKDDNGFGDIVGSWKETSYSQSKEWDDFDEAFGTTEDNSEYYLYFTADGKCYDIEYDPASDYCTVELTEYSYKDGEYYGPYGIKLNIKISGNKMSANMFGINQEYTKVSSLPDVARKKIENGDVEDLTDW